MAVLSHDSLTAFKQKLKQLCEEHEIWIQWQGERRENPEAKVYFYEWQLKAKVHTDASELFVEQKQRF